MHFSKQRVIHQVNLLCGSTFHRRIKGILDCGVRSDSQRRRGFQQDIHGFAGIAFLNLQILQDPLQRLFLVFQGVAVTSQEGAQAFLKKGFLVSSAGS